MRSPSLLDERHQFMAEPLRRNAHGILAAGLGGYLARARLKLVDRAANGRGRLSIEKYGRRLSIVETAKRFGGTALVKSDDRRTARLGLEWRNAEILFGGKDKRLGPLEMISQRFRRLPAQKLDVWCRRGLAFFPFGTRSDHDQILFWHRGKGFDDQRNLLVRHHARSRH